jgi:hypothetical protein
MAYIDTEAMPLHMPVPGTREPAQIALLNENCVVIAAHDHTTGKGMAAGKLRNGLEANRPAAGTAGNVYFSTDTGKFFVDTGTTWVEFITSGSVQSVTGWTLIDPIIRDTLSFGPEPTGTPDATLSRTGPGALRADTHLGVAVAPGAWRGDIPALQVGQGGAVYGQTSSPNVFLSGNSVLGTGGYVALTANPAARVQIDATTGSVLAATAPSVAAGAAQTFTTRLAVAPTGTLTITPDAGQAAYAGTLNGAAFSLSPGISAAGGGSPRLISAAGTWIEVDPAGGAFVPSRDNAIACGYLNNRWNAVYAVAGAINTSSREDKEGITPLDPLACYQAAKDVRWYEFAYLPPAYQEPEPSPDIAYDAADDNETKAEKKARRDDAEAQAKAAHLKMVAETAPARHQRGFVFPDGAEAKDEAGGALPPVPDLFGLEDRQSTTPQADIATLGCAMQEIIRRLEALESGQQAPAA